MPFSNAPQTGLVRTEFQWRLYPSDCWNQNCWNSSPSAVYRGARD